MKITLDISQQLLDEAMAITGSKTHSQAVIQALQGVIRKSTISELKCFKGAVELDIDLAVLRGRNKN